MLFKLIGRGNCCRMVKLNSFTDFDAFQASRRFVREVRLLIRTPKFRRNRELFTQMERAAISVLSNFAEGFERDGNAEFVQFLTISKGSIGELRGQLIYSLDVGLIDEALQTVLDDKAATATRMVGGLIRYLSGTELMGRKIRTTGRKQVKPPSPATPQPLTSNCKP